MHVVYEAIGASYAVWSVRSHVQVRIVDF